MSEIAEQEAQRLYPGSMQRFQREECERAIKRALAAQRRQIAARVRTAVGRCYSLSRVDRETIMTAVRGPKARRKR